MTELPSRQQQNDALAHHNSHGKIPGNALRHNFEKSQGMPEGIMHSEWVKISLK